MDNYAIAEQFSLLARLMDIHGENPFKSKSYASAAFALEKLEVPVSGLAPAEIQAVKGIGQSAGARVQELLDTGRLNLLEELIAQTPPGILEMLQLKGLGPKKINTVWKELNIDNLQSLKQACADGRIAATKGFGAKTQEKLLEAIDFHLDQTGLFLYMQVEPFAAALEAKLNRSIPDSRTAVAGAFRRQCEVVQGLDIVSTLTASQLEAFFAAEGMSTTHNGGGVLETLTPDGLPLRFYLCSEENFSSTLFLQTGSEAFLKAWKDAGYGTLGESEEALFDAAELVFIPPCLRESGAILDSARQRQIPGMIQQSDIRGIVHAHSNWSDGAHSLEEFALGLKEQGYEYLVISDHSKAAFYANGLTEERIIQQHRLIDQLNTQLAPFRIYKSIECDILGDGSMDYSNDVLATFDLVIASIHSNLDMTEEKAMMRLMGAITNPYVSILGHLTGRLLGRRKGYPVDHKAIIDACARHHVVIEINSSPVRLDMDWRWIDYALEQGLLLSINPDAHSFEDVSNLPYGIKVAQKGGLTATRNLSSFTRAEFDAFLENQQAKRPKVLPV